MNSLFIYNYSHSFKHETLLLETALVMMKPSRFLSEIDQHLTEEMELEESLPHLIAGAEPDISSDSEQT